MKIRDRLLVIRRAILIAANPDFEAVVMVRAGKNMELHKNVIFTNRDTGKDVYIKYIQSFFLDNAKSGESLQGTALYFLKGVQDRWNESHPTDRVSFIAESKE